MADKDRVDRPASTDTPPPNHRHRDDRQALETTEFQDPDAIARQILDALPQVVAMLPPTEVRAVLQRVEGIEWDDNSDGQHPWDQGPNSDAMKTYDDCF